MRNSLAPRAPHDLRRLTRHRIVLPIALALAAQFAFGLPTAHAGKPGAGGTSCSKRNPCDTTPPAVTILAPASGSTVSGTVTAQGTASDNVSLSKVQVKVDSGSPALASGATSWTDSIDTTVLADGSHLITATATDASGNATSASVTVNISNAPAPTPTTSPTQTPSPTNTGTPVAAPTMAPGTIGGYAFQETDRDGVFDTGETPLSNQNIYLFSGSGAYLTHAYSDSSGWYQFTGLGDGTYRVAYESTSAAPLEDNWVPSTTGSIKASRGVTLSGTAHADFGWRPIVRSTTQGSPITSYVATNGLRVESYDDVVTASQIYNNLMQGTLVGPEASKVTVRFDFSSTSSTVAGVAFVNGQYTGYNAISYVAYSSWLLTGDQVLFHEYGHAWSLYYTYIVQQDPNFSGYLQARGLLGDPRVDSTYGWNRREMIAEDYRELFGTPSAAGFSQMNQEIPRASAVPGLRDYLAGVFMQPPA